MSLLSFSLWGLAGIPVFYILLNNLRLSPPRSSIILLNFIFLRLNSFVFFYCCFHLIASLCFICNFETIYSSFIAKYTSITFVFVWANKFSPYHFGIFSATKNHVKFYSHIYCFRTYDGYKSCVYNATVFLFSAEIYTQIQTETHIYTDVYLYIRPKHTTRSQRFFFSSVLCVTSRAP